MVSAEPDKLYARGLTALASDDTLSALVLFEKASQLDSNPASISYFAFCLAKERGQYKRAVCLCKEALEKDAENPIHYLNLGRIHVLMGSKSEAIKIFRNGLTFGQNTDIALHLEKLGARKKPILPFLARGNPINKFLGIVFSKLGIR